MNKRPSKVVRRFAREERRYKRKRRERLKQKAEQMDPTRDGRRPTPEETEEERRLTGHTSTTTSTSTTTTTTPVGFPDPSRFDVEETNETCPDCGGKLVRFGMKERPHLPKQRVCPNPACLRVTLRHPNEPIPRNRSNCGGVTEAQRERMQFELDHFVPFKPGDVERAEVYLEKRRAHFGIGQRRPLSPFAFALLLLSIAFSVGLAAYAVAILVQALS